MRWPGQRKRDTCCRVACLSVCPIPNENQIVRNLSMLEFPVSSLSGERWDSQAPPKILPGSIFFLLGPSIRKYIFFNFYLLHSIKCTSGRHYFRQGKGAFNEFTVCHALYMRNWYAEEHQQPECWATSSCFQMGSQRLRHSPSASQTLHLVQSECECSPCL